MVMPLISVVCALISMVTLGLAVGMSKLPTVAIGVKRFVFWRELDPSCCAVRAVAHGHHKLAIYRVHPTVIFFILYRHPCGLSGA